MTTYLENVLSTLKENTDVVVKLNSFHTYDDIRLQDCCGNHFAINWINAINHNDLQDVFEVDEIKVNVYEWDNNRSEYQIILKNVKDEFTAKLEIESNNEAINRMFDFD